jgi:hypothetical protein
LAARAAHDAAAVLQENPMSRSAYVAVFPLFLAASSLLQSARHAAPPVPGPGAVIHAIEEFL